MDGLGAWLADARSASRQLGRPLITLSYAQSLDGCLTLERGRPFSLSGEDTRRMTHRLRSMHDGILVGIGTVLADNPRLNVRLADGPDPRPIVLDTHLRIPPGSALLQKKDNLPWIAAGMPVDPARKQALEARGARVLEFPRSESGRVDLPELLHRLAEDGITSLMVEGGAEVIAAFLGLRLVDWVVITVAPVFLGGLPAVEGGAQIAGRLHNPQWVQLGHDAVVMGRLEEREK